MREEIDALVVCKYEIKQKILEKQYLFKYKNVLKFTKKKKYLENIKKIINCRKAEEFERNRVPFFARQSPFPFSWKFLHTFISPLYPFISEQFAILYTRS